MPDSNLHQLSALGQSVWIDYLSRDLLQTGELARMMKDDAVVGITSNPTIFQKAISAGNRYDAQLKEILEEYADRVRVLVLGSLHGVGIQWACVFRARGCERSGRPAGHRLADRGGAAVLVDAAVRGHRGAEPGLRR